MRTESCTRVRKLAAIFLAFNFLALLGCGAGSSVTSVPTTTPTTTAPTTNPNPAPQPLGLWTWVAGSNTVGQSGVYGTLGTPAPGNTPGARYQAASWVDAAGNLWMFGGETAPSSTSDSDFNDLWRYSAGQWTWMGGSSSFNSLGSYGSQGVAAASNAPGARAGAVTWKDRSGNFWLFGGLGLGQYQNDLWEYTSGQWIWIGGSQYGAQGVGVYGDKGIVSPNNNPGARSMAVSWTDSAGDFWLFGGLGLDSAGSIGRLNDLWKYSAGEWTWIGGSNVVNQPGTYGVQGTPAAENIPSGRFEASGWTDAAGNLWLFGGTSGGNTMEPLNDLWKYSGGQWTWMSGSNTPNQQAVYGTQGVAAAGNVPSARVAAVASSDASGNLWLLGGDGYDSAQDFGELNDVWRYSAGQWTWMGGSNLVGQAGVYGTLGSAALGTIPGARWSATVWQDPAGSVWLLGGDGRDVNKTFGYLNDLWKFQP